MGQKVNPNGIRLGITKPFSSTWYAGTKQFPSYLQGDFAVRNYLTAKLKDASVSKIIIDRPAKSIKVTIRTARPGIVVGKSGANIEPLRLEVPYIEDAGLLLCADANGNEHLVALDAGPLPDMVGWEAGVEVLDAIVVEGVPGVQVYDGSVA